VLGSIIAFGVASTLVTLLPGPDFMLVLRNAFRGGRRIGWCTAAGTTTGIALWAVAASLGLSSLVAASRIGYDVLRFVGAAYLIWLGIAALRSRKPTGMDEIGDERPPGVDCRSAGAIRAYLTGVISDLCNPKVGAFFIAFLPGFVPAHASVSEFSLLFGLWNAVEVGAYFAVVVWLISRGTARLHHPRIRRRLEQVTGIALIGFGVRLATEAR
jgi:threonine/homoserine/homoserine lactone efflux protein